MIIFFIIFSLIIGWLRGGDIERFSRMVISFPALIITSFFIQAALPWLTSSVFSPFSLFLLVFSYLLLTFALIVNRKQLGFMVATVGILLNLLVITVNGGMPVSSAGFNESEVFHLESRIDGVHTLLDGATRLPWLADVIQVPLPSPFGGLASIGDVILGVGMFIIIQMNMVYIGKRRKKKVPVNES